MSGWETSTQATNIASGGHGDDSWKTSDMAAALPDVQDNTYEKASTEVKTEDTGNQNSGWAERRAYDYDNLGRPGGEDWDGNARIYEWDGEEGDIGPEHPELERMLFGDPDHREGTQGLDFSKIANIQLYQEGPERVEPIFKFEDAGLHPAMRKNVALAGYGAPTPIQKYCIPAITLGYDVIAIAQTGSGKTAAYLIPILNKLMGKAKKLAAPRPNPSTFVSGIDGVRAEPLVVIVAPTRELAVQIFSEARKFCYRSMLRPAVLYGGISIREQMKMLEKGCDILVATPGRLIDFMDRPNNLTLRRLRYMVIDEADEMLHTDWEVDLQKILGGGEQEEGNVKYMLFSATFPKKIRDLAKTHLAETHVRFRVGRAGSTHENIKQQIVFTDPAMKKQALLDLLGSMPPARTIIFVNYKTVVDELDDFLFNKELPCTGIHASRTQREREDSLRNFRAGNTPILIATGVSSRGIDVRNVMHVINYDLPSLDHGGIEEYTHRIGRTGRIGHRGLATSFYTERDEPMASVLTRTLLETKQEVPEFLQSYIPEGEAREKLKFEADSDWEEEMGGGEGGADAWGDGAAANPPGDAWGSNGDNAGGAWGASGDAPKETTTGGDDAPKTSGDWGGSSANNGGQPSSGGWGDQGGDFKESKVEKDAWGNPTSGTGW